MKSLVGNKYGKLTVVSRADDEVLSNGHLTVRYHCLCECGCKTIVRATALTSGHTRSCGCSRKESMIGKNVIDMKGRRFGSWVVLEQVGSNSNREAVWKCQCDCGNIKIFTRRALVNGIRLECKKCKNTDLDLAVISQKTKLIGERFSRWTVVDYAGVRVSKNGREYRQWKCVCDCGTVRAVDEMSLISHKSTSCGCYRKEQALKSVTFDDLSGNRYGRLVVLRRNGSKHYPGGGQSQIYECRCDCGNVVNVARAMLVSGQTESCGCLVYSKMESWCTDVFKQYGIEYKHNLRFDDLIGLGGGMLSYDFGIYKDGCLVGLIECQGEQHFRSVDYFGGEEKFKMQQSHDTLKREYALVHSVPLLELSYKLMKNDFINVLSKFIEKRCSQR